VPAWEHWVEFDLASAAEWTRYSGSSQRRCRAPASPPLPCVRLGSRPGASAVAASQTACKKLWVVLDNSTAVILKAVAAL
jgi:hypothetical protein